MKKKWQMLAIGLITTIGLSAPLVMAGGPSQPAPSPPVSTPEVPVSERPAAGPAPVVPQQIRYVALGDSIAAGAGLFSGSNGTDEVCDRSRDAYPEHIAEHLGTNVANYACTGAKIDEGIYGSQLREDTQLLPQIDKAFMNGPPDVVTMTVGANDVRWAEFIINCFAQECGTTAETYAAKLLRADLRAELYYALTKMQNMSGSQVPDVYVSGYYMPLTPDITCTGLKQERLTAAEFAWIQSEQEALNAAIQETVARFDFATYVPLDFTGHELCSDDREIQSVTSRMALHPTRDGQKIIADSFIAAMR